MTGHKLHEIGRSECVENGCEPDLPDTSASDWVCEQCGDEISEDEYQGWGTCEACERSWCDDVDAASRFENESLPEDKPGSEHLFDADMLTDDGVCNLLMQARKLLSEAWKANMDAADYKWNQTLSRKIDAAMADVSDTIEYRIFGRKLRTAQCPDCGNAVACNC